MPPVQKPTPSNRSSADRLDGRFSRRGLGLLLVATSLLFGLRLGQLDFWAPDEPRYGAIAEELRSFRHGAEGLVLLHLNDRPYTQKPPLYFWLAALAGTPGGRVTEWAARWPSAVAGLGCVALTAWIARRLLGDPRGALLAAGLLATSFRFVFTARRAQLDVLLTLFELIALAIFVGLQTRGQPRRATPDAAGDRPHPPRLAIAVLHGALGAAALTKGPVGWLPLAILAAHLGWQGRLRDFRQLAPAWAWGLSIGPVALWIGAATALAPAGFADVAVTENLIGRFFAGTSHARPFYYFLYQLPADFLPWTVLLPFGFMVLFRACRSGADASAPTRDGVLEQLFASRLLACWIAVPFAFFTLSAGKRGLYLLPIFPALAIVGASGLARTASFLRDPARAARRWGMAIGAVALLELAALVLAAPLLEPEKSPRPIAEAIAARTRPDEIVGVYGLEPIEGAIAYYGDRRVEALPDPDRLRSFLDTGGRLILLRARHLEALAQESGLQPVARFRRGRRQLVLAERPPRSGTGR